MGLRETLEAGVQTAFAQVGNMKKSITIREQTGGSYTAATGAVVRTTADHPVQAVIRSPNARELAAPAVRVTDLVAFWDPSEDPGFEPQVNMSVLYGTQEYTIFQVDSVGPADGGPALLWRMILRRPSAEAA